MTKDYLVRLPWPPAVLSPNARAHYMRRASAAKSYRRDCCIEAQAMGCRQLGWDGLHAKITFHPPDNRRRDVDNLLAQIKSGLDGIADATGVDDSLWQYSISRSAPIKGGAVLVHVKHAEPSSTPIEIRGSVR